MIISVMEIYDHDHPYGGNHDYNHYYGGIDDHDHQYDGSYDHDGVKTGTILFTTDADFFV